ncbi:hypothetical protein DXD68_22510 [Parabacteroides sp. TM07-1AC]|uniref:HU family DNA-binding protein n=2 Tax=Parabacteroides TaxID=375288 RepID=UPI000EFF43D9|nr:HU family DNA-binding protein [Parabacteroides sp. TM07-1AC]RHU22004.1 hypothetical protein DXD68_22510 [Parabacteroides sp. TM07-1AC]
MALQYHLVLRKNLSKDVEAGKEKLYYAQTRATGTCTFEELCALVAQSSTASSGDVKVVIDRVIEFLLLFLARGEVVQCGEFGTFQLVQTSSGSPTTEDFSSALLYRARLRFRPGEKLRNLIQTTKGERFKLEETKSSGSDNEDDRPVIE